MVYNPLCSSCVEMWVVYEFLASKDAYEWPKQAKDSQTLDCYMRRGRVHNKYSHKKHHFITEKGDSCRLISGWEDC